MDRRRGRQIYRYTGKHFVRYKERHAGRLTDLQINRQKNHEGTDVYI
jgi:hypothetical protein